MIDMSLKIDLEAATLILISITSIIVLSGLIWHGAFGQSATLDEDQLMLCNFKDICQVVNIDDYMNKANSTKLWYNYNHDLDTFTLSNSAFSLKQLDNECRDNYHQYCFGESWANIQEVLSK